ncbi:MAG TPA: hypothetical protein VIL55_04270 [Naasia sp.]|jgi:hypothetical protein
MHSPARTPHRQNEVGDVVVPQALGEVVALPRLWDFDMTAIGSTGCVLTTADGLRADIRFEEDTAVVEGVIVVEPLAVPRAVRA